jgi:hypothetical protein
MKTISRETAIQLGLKRYFTGVPCIHGHISERLVKTHGGGECVACNRLSQKKHKERNLERVRLRNRLAKQKQRARDPERVRQQWREWAARRKAKGNQESRRNGNVSIS